MSYINTNPHRPLSYKKSDFHIYELKYENRLLAVSNKDNKKIEDIRKNLGDFQEVSSTEKITCYLFKFDEINNENVLETNSPVEYEAGKLIPSPKKIGSKKELNTILGNIDQSKAAYGYPAPPDFSNTIFDFKNEEINFSERHFPYPYASFDDSIFKGKVNFSDAIFSASASFNRTIFNGEVIFDDAEFNEKTTFYGVEFIEKATFENTVFEKLADFWGAKFHKKQIFYKTDFKKTTVFSRTTFFENVLFTYSLLGKNTIFRHAKFEKGFDLSLAANIEGNLNLFNIDFDFNKYLAIPKNKERDYDDLVSGTGEIPLENKRETFRILKDQLMKQNNKIEAIDYNTFEMKAYKAELKWEKGMYGEKVMMWLNKSNAYGKTWVWPILYALGFTLLFFIIIVINQSPKLSWAVSYSTNDLCKIFHIFWENIGVFFQLLNPAHDIDKLKISNGQIIPWTYFIDYSQRIILSYLIFQTISAFRKHIK